MTDKDFSELPPRRYGNNERRVRLPKQPSGERRGVIRYPLALRLRYSVLNPRTAKPETGSGQTIDLSSSGLRFLAEKPIEPGRRVELFLDWPFLLDNDVELQLIASGTVVRNNGSEVALRMQRHDFKTRGRGLTTVWRQSHG